MDAAFAFDPREPVPASAWPPPRHGPDSATGGAPASEPVDCWRQPHWAQARGVPRLAGSQRAPCEAVAEKDGREVRLPERTRLHLAEREQPPNYHIPALQAHRPSEGKREKLDSRERLGQEQCGPQPQDTRMIERARTRRQHKPEQPEWGQPAGFRDSPDSRDSPEEADFAEEERAKDKPAEHQQSKASPPRLAPVDRMLEVLEVLEVLAALVAPRGHKPQAERSAGQSVEDKAQPAELLALRLGKREVREWAPGFGSCKTDKDRPHPPSLQGRSA